MRFTFSRFLIIICWVVRKNCRNDPQKGSPFECGFDPIGRARGSFSLRYFLLAIIFIVFDVEVILLFPIVGILRYRNIYSRVSIIVFLSILLVGLFYE